MHHQHQMAKHETSVKYFNALVRNIRWLLGLRSLHNVVLDNKSDVGVNSHLKYSLYIIFFKSTFDFCPLEAFCSVSIWVLQCLHLAAGIKKSPCGGKLCEDQALSLYHCSQDLKSIWDFYMLWGYKFRLFHYSSCKETKINFTLLLNNMLAFFLVKMDIPLQGQYRSLVQNKWMLWTYYCNILAA